MRFNVNHTLCDARRAATSDGVMCWMGGTFYLRTGVCTLTFGFSDEFLVFQNEKNVGGII